MIKNRIIAQLYCEGHGRSDVAKNSTAVQVGDFVTLDGGAVTAATAGKRIDGLSNHTKTFTADNETVARAKLVYVKSGPTLLVEVDIDGGTVTAADEGKYYDLKDAHTVDGTTEATDFAVANVTTGAITFKQLRLVRFVSATRGVFAVVYSA